MHWQLCTVSTQGFNTSWAWRSLFSVVVPFRRGSSNLCRKGAPHRRSSNLLLIQNPTIVFVFGGEGAFVAIMCFSLPVSILVPVCGVWKGL